MHTHKQICLILKAWVICACGVQQQQLQELHRVACSLARQTSIMSGTADWRQTTTSWSLSTASALCRCSS